MVVAKYRQDTDRIQLVAHESLLILSPEEAGETIIALEDALKTRAERITRE